MKANIKLLGRPLDVATTASADAALRAQATPLRVEMELYFSCLIGKTLRFGDATHGELFSDIAPNLQVGFRAVQTQGCRVDDLSGPRPARESFPIVAAERFIPKWLAIDFRDGVWQGAFGFCLDDPDRPR